MNKQDPKDDQRLLQLLDVVGRRSDVSQRHLAQQMGVALGLANSYLKRCIRKGLIKITEAPARRYLYYLTPKGFSEKSRLTAKYLAASFEFYRAAGESCVRVLQDCEQRGWRGIVLCGASDLAEIASLRAIEKDIQVVGVFDVDTQRQKFLGQNVLRTLREASFDCCIVTELQAPHLMYQRLRDEVGRERVLVPDILGL